MRPSLPSRNRDRFTKFRSQFAQPGSILSTNEACRLGEPTVPDIAPGGRVLDIETEFPKGWCGAEGGPFQGCQGNARSRSRPARSRGRAAQVAWAACLATEHAISRIVGDQRSRVDQDWDEFSPSCPTHVSSDLHQQLCEALYPAPRRSLLARSGAFWVARGLVFRRASHRARSPARWTDCFLGRGKVRDDAAQRNWAGRLSWILISSWPSSAWLGFRFRM